MPSTIGLRLASSFSVRAVSSSAVMVVGMEAEAEAEGVVIDLLLNTMYSLLRHAANRVKALWPIFSLNNDVSFNLLLLRTCKGYSTPSTSLFTSKQATFVQILNIILHSQVPP